MLRLPQKSTFMILPYHIRSDFAKLPDQLFRPVGIPYKDNWWKHSALWW